MHRLVTPCVLVEYSILDIWYVLKRSFIFPYFWIYPNPHMTTDIRTGAYLEVLSKYIYFKKATFRYLDYWSIIYVKSDANTFCLFLKESKLFLFKVYWSQIRSRYPKICAYLQVAPSQILSLHGSSVHANVWIPCGHSLQPCKNHSK